jgi:hypothetical protein
MAANHHRKARLRQKPAYKSLATDRRSSLQPRFRPHRRVSAGSLMAGVIVTP